jgi:selenoprotein W-related protein
LAENVLHDYYEQLPGGVVLTPGSGGIFEVELNGNLIFSKEETGRFPQENEVEEMLEGLLSAEKPAPPASKNRASVGFREG